MFHNKNGFTLKAILTGLIGVIIICAVEPYNAYYIGGTHTVGNHFPIAAIFLFLIIVLIHLALKHLKQSYGYTPAELIIIWCMLIVVAAIPYSGLVRYLFPLIPAPVYFATPENEWENLLVRHLSDWLILKDKLAIEDFYNGEQSVPWMAWLKPLIAWSAFVIVMYFVMMCICVILRKQWVERERFSFPLVQIPGEIAQQSNSPGLLRDFFSNRLLWIGAAVPVVLHSLNALNLYFPAVPRIPLDRFFWGAFPNKPWTPLNSVRISVYFSVVGFTYLIPLEISFSMWFFFLFYKTQSIILNALGVPIGESVFAHRQGMGAYLVITVYIFWIGKEHIRHILHRAFTKGDRLSNDSNEPFPYRWAILGLIFGIGLMTIMCVAVGMSLWVSICILLIFFFVAIVLTWMVSNSGLLFVQQTFLPSEYLQTIIGTSSISPSSWAVLGFQEGLMWDLREIMMPHFMNSFRIVDYADMKRRKVVIAISIAVITGMLVSYYSYLKLTYHYGGANSVAYQSFIARPKLFFGASASAISNPSGTNWQETSVIFGGMAFMAFLLLMRYRFVWWPLHPAGYLMHLSWSTQCLWASFFMGWLLKYLLIRLGGVGAYRRFRPVFLGAVLGESVIGCIWVIVGMITKTAYSILPS